MVQVSTDRFASSHTSPTRTDSFWCIERGAHLRRRSRTPRLPTLGATAGLVQSAVGVRLALRWSRLEKSSLFHVPASPFLHAVLGCKSVHLVLRCAAATVHNSCCATICNAVVVYGGRVGTGNNLVSLLALYDGSGKYAIDF